MTIDYTKPEQQQTRGSGRGFPVFDLNKRLISELSKRTLAEYAVFMTICGIGAFFIAMFAAGPLSRRLSGYALFAAAATVWLGLMTYLWLHFFHAARRAQLAPTSTRLFHTIQMVALAFAAIPLVIWRGSEGPWLFFHVVAFGVEAALGVFFIFYIFLAGTLCKRMPRGAFPGLIFAMAGYGFSWQYIATHS